MTTPRATVLYVRTDATTLRRIDAEAARQAKATPGRRVTRSDIARELLCRELTRLEAERFPQADQWQSVPRRSK